MKIIKSRQSPTYKIEQRIKSMSHWCTPCKNVRHELSEETERIHTGPGRSLIKPRRRLSTRQLAPRKRRASLSYRGVTRFINDSLPPRAPFDGLLARACELLRVPAKNRFLPELFRCADKRHLGDLVWNCGLWLMTVVERYFTLLKTRWKSRN